MGQLNAGRPAIRQYGHAMSQGRRRAEPTHDGLRAFKLWDAVEIVELSRPTTDSGA
jgi:hypothetical protein